MAVVGHAASFKTTHRCSTMNKFTIRITDSKVAEFLAILTFGETKDIVEVACFRAYHDMCRTIRGANGKKFSDISEEIKSAMKAKVTQTIKDRLSSMKAECHNQNGFDHWHKETCITIQNDFMKTIGNGWKLSYGQAQKWINMALKYLYVLSYHFTESQLVLFHAPLDSYVFSVAQDELSVRKPSSCWSKLDYDRYFGYQKELRAKVKGTTVFAWEFGAWNNEAARRGVTNA